jgi:hypothetical protein
MIEKKEGSFCGCLSSGSRRKPRDGENTLRKEMEKMD